MTAEDEDRNKADLAQLAAHCGQLLERFDTVQIICTRDNGNAGTTHASYGIGNWYARHGSVTSWLRRQEAQDVRDGAE